MSIIEKSKQKTKMDDNALPRDQPAMFTRGSSIKAFATGIAFHPRDDVLIAMLMPYIIFNFVTVYVDNSHSIKPLLFARLLSKSTHCVVYTHGEKQEFDNIIIHARLCFF